MLKADLHIDPESGLNKARDVCPNQRTNAKQVPKIKNGVINIAQIIGPKLKAAGYDLKSPEGKKSNKS